MKMRLVFFMIFLSVIFTEPSYSLTPVQRPNDEKEAEIVSVQGEGWVRFVSSRDWIDALYRQVLISGDTVRIGNYGKMHILFVDDLQIQVHKNSMVFIKHVGKRQGRKGTVLGLSAGEIWSRAKSMPEGLRIETPSATAAIRGTDWAIEVDEEGKSRITVLRGQIEFYNEYGKVLVQSGEQATAEIGKPPHKTFLVRPRDRVQWIVSYPIDIPGMVTFHSHRKDALREMLPPSVTPGDIRAKLFLAGLLFDLGEFEESRNLFDEILADDSMNCRALIFRGMLSLRSREDERAASYFTKALKNCRNNEKTEAVIGMSGVHLQRNEIEKAAILLGNLEKHDTSAVLGVVLSSFHAFLGNFTHAITISKEYALEFPEDERFPILLSGFHMMLDEPANVDQAIAVNPRSSSAFSLLASLYHLEGMGNDAENAYRKAIAIDPKNHVAHNGLGLVLMEKAYYRESESEFAQAINNAPQSSLLWSSRGILHTITDDMHRAMNYIQKSLELDPSNYLSLNARGLLALKQGKTDEAVQFFLKSSLLEPDFAQTHVFLAIAYYQSGDISHALDEIRLAESLDPKDPYPHLIAYIIYQDTYRPFDAVREAQKVLELLPYLKSIEPLENTRAGLLNLGSALLGLGMTDWAESYAQASFDPHTASSHFFSSRRYNENHIVSVSELVQGLIFDPLAHSNPNRYNDIIRKPRHDTTLSATLGDEDGGFSRQFSLIAQGFFRKNWDIAYSLVLQSHDRDGFSENGYSEGHTFVYGMGLKPDYDNGFTIGVTSSRDKSGYPGSASDPDPDDRLEFSTLNIDIGYRHRFGPKDNFLARFVYDRTEFEQINPAPFGTSLSDIQLSFLNAGYDPQTTRDFFEAGVYDLTSILGGPGISLATDSTGALAANTGARRLPPSFPSFIDYDVRHTDTSEQETFLFQTRHLFDIGDRHQLTYGLEYIPFRQKTETVFNMIEDIGSIEFYEEVFSPDGQLWTFPLVTSSVASQSTKSDGRFVMAYVHDRWKMTGDFLLEAGIFYEHYHDDNNSLDVFYPRIGIAAAIGHHHILRLGFQKWLDQSSSGTLSPVATAGLVIDNGLALQGSRITDYQARLESRWTDRLFTAFGFERVELEDPDMGEGFLKRELYTHSFTASVNAILSQQTGLFFRYRYTDSKITDGIFESNSVPGIPYHLATGGIIWVSPSYVKVMLSSSYVGRQFEGYYNARRVSDFLVAGISVSSELFEKQVLLACSVSNIFNANDPAPGRSAYLTLQYRF